jgi:16S rRNA (cytidine1402-2'-O)-methyltransferase
VSGFDLSSFAFLGFFPRENAERLRLLDTMRRDRTTATFALYESPRRIMGLIDFLIENEARCRVCLMNDMTKLHEMSFRGSPAEVREQLLQKGNYEKGEYALVLELEEDYRYQKEEHLVSPEAMLVDAMMQGLDSKAAIAAVLQDQNNSYSKNELKAAALNLKKLFS